MKLNPQGIFWIVLDVSQYDITNMYITYPHGTWEMIYIYNAGHGPKYCRIAVEILYRVCFVTVGV